MTALIMAGLGLVVVARQAPAVPADEVPAGEERTATLLYIADLHAQLESHPGRFWQGDRAETVEAGGVARIASAVEAIRRERPGEVLFMDAGDTIQGSAAAAWTEGRAVIPPVNALGLDLGIPGNWEVVYGAETLKRRAAEFRHPLVAANLKDAGTGELLFPPYLVQEVGGVRIGVIGLTDPDVPQRQPPSYSAGLSFDGAEVLQPLIDELRHRVAVDLVVVLAHVGLPKAIGLAERLSGVDVVLSSDTHERTYEPIVRGETWVVEPGSFGSFLGRLDLTVRDGKVVDRRWELIELRADRFPEEPQVKQIVDETLAPLRPRLGRVVGTTQAPLMRYNVVETSLDLVLSDALREAAGTQIGLSNGFRFAAPLPAGPIRESDLWDWYPITTPLKVGKVSGRQLREFWERELEHVFAADPEQLFGGWVPRPSGMALRFVADAPMGERVREIRVGGEPLEEDRAYTVVACEREGDDPHTVCRIPNVREPRVLDLDAHEAVRRYLGRHSPLAAPEGGRVVADDLPPVVRSQVLRPDRPGRAGVE